MTRPPRKQTQFKIATWGGRRANSGRKNRSKTVNHMKRHKVSGRYPMHLTMRLQPGLKSLRTQQTLAAFQRAVVRAQEFGLRVLHFSLQTNHIHLIVEADTHRALASGMRSFGGSFGKYLRRQNPQHKERTLFNGRYHQRVITNSLQMRHTLKYVLLNHARHKNWVEHLDPYSSGAHFQYWKKLLGRRFAGIIATEVEILREREVRGGDGGEDPPVTLLPRSWLARTGWRS